MTPVMGGKGREVGLNLLSDPLLKKKTFCFALSLLLLTGLVETCSVPCLFTLSQYCFRDWEMGGGFGMLYFLQMHCIHYVCIVSALLLTVHVVRSISSHPEKEYCHGAGMHPVQI
jgi:hypothetical protein